MIELLDTSPAIAVQPAEFKRLLGYPPDHQLDERAQELMEWARAWFAENARPWIYARQANNLTITGRSIVIDGTAFCSKHLLKTLQQSHADGIVLVAVSAGAELERAAQTAWQADRPDEYFFLETFGSAVVEHLIATTGARLCAWAEAQAMAVLPHYSPGYPDWDIAQQAKLLQLIKQGAAPPLPAALEVMESGMLRPKKSLLAVFGLTRHRERTARLTDLVPCGNCSFMPCQFRRAPYASTPAMLTSELPVAVGAPEAATSNSVLDQDAPYGVNPKALRRWAADRLTLTPNADGTITALFRYEGTTCSNMGRPLLFNYTVKLGPRHERYPILHQQCEPAPGDDGYTYMCRYVASPEQLMTAIDIEKPLLGRPLNDVLSWDRPLTGAGCYCDSVSRTHKWGLVLETIHYALAQQELKSAPAAEEAQVP